MDDLITEYNLVDATKLKLSSDALAYTRFKGPSQAGLDRMYLSVLLANRAANYKVKPIPFSGHCLVALGFGDSRHEKYVFNWGFRKLNSTLLKDDKFLEQIIMCSKEMIVEGVTISERLNNFEGNVKFITRDQSSEIIYQIRARQRQLKGNLKYLCQLKCRSPGAGIQDMDYIKTQLNHIVKNVSVELQCEHKLNSAYLVSSPRSVL